MSRYTLTLLMLPLFALAYATLARSAPLSPTFGQQTEIDDPYIPPAGDPDIFAPEDGGQVAPPPTDANGD